MRPIEESSPVVMLTKAQLAEVVRQAVSDVLEARDQDQGPEAKWLTGEELARRLGVSRTQVHQLRTRDGCPAVLVGKKAWKFDPVAVDQWLRSRGK